MLKVADAIIAMIKSIYGKEEEVDPVVPRDPKKQLRQIKGAVEHVLKEVKEREESAKDNFIDQVRAEHEGYIDMKLMLEIIRDSIKL